MSVSLWESEEALQQNEQTAQRTREQGQQQLGGTTTVERYEVVVHG